MATKQLAGPVELLKSSWEILKARWRTFVAIQLVPVLILIPVGIIAVLVFGVYGVSKSVADGHVPTDLAGFITAFKVIAPVALVMGLISGLLQLWANLALIFVIKDWKEDIGFKGAFRLSWKILRSYLWVSFLVGLAVMGGLILLVIPGLIFGVLLAFSGYILIDQGVKGKAALKASMALVKGRFWAVVGRIAVIAILGLILTSVGEYISKAWENTPMAWIGVLGTFVVSFMWTPFAVAYAWLLYSSLKSTKN